MVQASVLNYKYIRNIVKEILHNDFKNIYIVKNKDSLTYTIFAGVKVKTENTVKVISDRISYQVDGEEGLYYFELISETESDELEVILSKLGYIVEVMDHDQYIKSIMEDKSVQAGTL